MVRSVKSTAAKQRAVLTAILLSALPWLMPSLAQAQASTDQLATQAHYWEDKGRFDLARESWLKLLRVSPDNPDALSGLALAEAKSGRGAAAQVYLDRLKSTHPDATGASKIEDAIRTGSFDQDKLQAPRALARTGKFDEAIASYKQIFNGQIPDGRLGLEYYQTLAGATDGWQPARDGLDKLAKANPDEPLYQMALAQHLTYHEETRRDGIASLQKLAGQPSIAAPAEQAWAQALVWLGAKPGDEHLYQSYLANHQNAQVSAKLETLRKGQQVAAAAPAQSGYPGRTEQPKALTAEQIRGQQVQAAYEKLNDNQLAEAGSMFEQILSSSPDSDDAMGGLGIVRLRQERYGEAHQYLQQASSMAPKRAARWKEALSSARFWEQVRAAQAARTAGDLSGAESMLRQAIATDPAIAAKETSVKGSLADILAEGGDVEGSEKLYREILASKPDDISAMRGLIAALVKQNRLPEALNLADRLPPDQKDELGNLGTLKGQYLRDQAKLATDAKDDAQAETLLKQALLEDPESPWTRLDLSRIYQREHRTREANTLIDGLLTGGKAMPEALYIKALLVAEQENWIEGLQILEQIPYEQRTQPMADLQRRLWVRYQCARAAVYTKYGRPQDAARFCSRSSRLLRIRRNCSARSRPVSPTSAKTVARSTTSVRRCRASRRRTSACACSTPACCSSCARTPSSKSSWKQLIKYQEFRSAAVDRSGQSAYRVSPASGRSGSRRRQPRTRLRVSRAAAAREPERSAPGDGAGPLCTTTPRNTTRRPSCTRKRCRPIRTISTPTRARSARRCR
jgi:Tfp pilus assembly protein PilF